MPNLNNSAAPSAWRLQDAKAQFSVVVENAMRGVPQHVTRRGKQAVVVVSEQDFEALQRSAAGQPESATSFVQHLLAIPKLKKGAPALAEKSDTARLDVSPRDLDLS